MQTLATSQESSAPHTAVVVRARRPKRAKLSTPAAKSLYQSLQERAPHYVSFDHIEDPAQRRAKELEQHIMLLADLFPECASAFKSAIALAHEVASKGKQSAADRVLAALQQPLAPAEMEEFVEDLSLPYATVYSAVMKLASKGLVELRELPAEPRPGKGGNRKTRLLVTLAHKL